MAESQAWQMPILMVPAIPLQERANSPKALKILRFSQCTKIDVTLIAPAFQDDWADNQLFLVTRLVNALSILTL